MVPRSGLAISVRGKGWQSGFQRQGSSPPTDKGVDLWVFVEIAWKRMKRGEDSDMRRAKGVAKKQLGPLWNERISEKSYMNQFIFHRKNT